MKRLFILIISIILILSSIFIIKIFNVKGIYDNSTGVYKNQYLDICIVPPPTFDMDENFTASKNNVNGINLFRAKNYVYEEQEINDKVDIIGTAIKLDSDFREYYSDFFSNESKKQNTQAISKVKKEKVYEKNYITQEYKNNDWYYKIYLLEKRGYAVNITIKYKDIKNKDHYLSRIEYITGLN